MNNWKKKINENKFVIALSLRTDQTDTQTLLLETNNEWFKCSAAKRWVDRIFMGRVSKLCDISGISGCFTVQTASHTRRYAGPTETQLLHHFKDITIKPRCMVYFTLGKYIYVTYSTKNKKINIATSNPGQEYFLWVFIIAGMACNYRVFLKINLIKVWTNEWGL